MTKAPIIRIAMWSGPRNISTAMMRAWENRKDTAVVDEPFYACFLTNSGLRHPMHDEVLGSQENTWEAVVSGVLSKPLAPSETIQYQKQMTHHMIGELDVKWFASLKHAFLIRHPADVIHSYKDKRDNGTAVDLGYARQRELYDLARQYSDTDVPVIDAKDVLLNPKAVLQQLCMQIGVAYDGGMLAWPPGLRKSDGVWAPHWYNKVSETTTFAPWKQKQYKLTPQQELVVEECLPHYDYLYQRRIKSD